MRRLIMTLALFASVLPATAAENTAVAQTSACGLEPIPPIPPIGCRAMRPVCMCDGGYPQSCHWEFQCVR